ncbi:hypothetical protein Q1695_016399 [Nippostrongylus brasiliensis]|nr:hypothetical protein Q1695_016399 [Nippostrongylus brasiliensis]
MRYAVTQRSDALLDYGGSTMKRFLILLNVALIASGSRAQSSKRVRCIERPRATTSTVAPTSPEPLPSPKPVVATKPTCGDWKKKAYDEFLAKYGMTTDCAINNKAEIGLKHYLKTQTHHNGIFVEEAFCQLKHVQPYGFHGGANVLTWERLTSYLQKLESQISAIKEHHPVTQFGCAVQVKTMVIPGAFTVRFNNHYLLCIYNRDPKTRLCYPPV